MCRHAWQGNVRELSNVLERALILADEGHIGLEELPSDVRELAQLRGIGDTQVREMIANHRTAHLEFFRDLSAALDRARELGFSECFIAGGEDIYREAMETADRVYLTRVDAEPEGDTRFPEIDEAKWQCVDRRPHPIDEHHVHSFAFETWDRAV